MNHRKTVSFDLCFVTQFQVKMDVLFIIFFCFIFLFKSFKGHGRADRVCLREE